MRAPAPTRRSGSYLSAGAAVFLVVVGVVAAFAPSTSGRQKIQEDRVVEINRDAIRTALEHSDEALRALEVRNYNDARSHLRAVRDSFATLLAAPDY